MMFSWYWSIPSFLLLVHFWAVFHSIYVHRGICHKQFVFSKTFHHIARFYLWIIGATGAKWAETYTARHRKHHRYSDTPMDPHSPHYKSFKEIRTNWYLDPEDIKVYSPDVHTPSDWIQTHVYDHFRKGVYIIYLLFFVLFGIVGMGIVIILFHLFWKYFLTYVGNYAPHSCGFTYPKVGRTNQDQSMNLFPIGLFLAGEELHGNHHNDATNPNYAHRWFEFDLGYAYAVIFSYLGLLKIRKKN
jgi:stearoyl-CoA desaturase (Delta-9 desaturase)